MSKGAPWDRIIERAHDALQKDFDDAVENYLQLNPGMALEDAKANAYDELRKDCRQALITQYRDFVNLVVILKKDPLHKQFWTTAKRLEIDDHFAEQEAMMYAVRKSRFLIEHLLDQYEKPSYSYPTHNPNVLSKKMKNEIKNVLSKEI